MAEAIRIHTEATGARPLGWYTGRSSENTLKLVLEDGGFAYSSDSYADDLPYWVNGPNGPHVIVPYTLDANDMRFINPQGFAHGEDFFIYLRDAFDVLYAEGSHGAENDVGRPALPARRTAWALCRACPLSRSCGAPQSCLGRDAARHCAALAA